ncbi:3'-5' exoribonuclease [Sphingomonas arenae]|uniref:3'-5' exoribonuclease n=1 Tax=Sphingomonas arenae TaxID=2812555 RepID=UPI001967C7E6|nr:3'-5' exoribonuclease [Sphingomonas arenae]
MRYFLDCEYNGFGGGLISLALVPEDGGEEFYAVVTCTEPLHEWVQRNVQPYLDHVPVGLQHPAQDPLEVAAHLSSWLSGFPDVEIVADWPEDIALFCRLLMTGPGQMVAVPALTFRLWKLPGFSTARNSTVPHNALHDARSLRDHLLGLEH